MFTILCLLAILGLGRCLDHLPTREEIEISINRTIQEVEKKIQADPSLPKLSRKDIVDILQNITTKDLISDYKTLEKTRNDYQRALMVVLPFNSNGAEENLRDLYTKPPIVQMLSDEDVFNEQERNQFEDSSKKQVSDNFIPAFPTTNAVHESVTTGHQYKDDKEKVNSKLYSTPERFSFDLGKLNEAATTTQRSVHTWRPVSKVPDPSESDATTTVVDFIYSTSLSTTEAPFLKSTQHVLSSNQWRYHPPPSTTYKPRYSPPHKEYFLPTVQSSPEEQYDYQKTGNTEGNSNSNTFKFLDSEAMTIPTAETEESPLFVTPMNEEKTKSPYKLPSEFSVTTPPTMRPEVEDLLESIGLRPVKNPDDLTFDKKIVEAKFKIPDSNNVIYNPNSGLSTSGIDTVSIADQNTFDNSDDQFKKGVENLTPAVQLLFKKFGLPTNLNFQSTTTTTTTTVKPTVASYYSYTNFKPLPNVSVRDKDMRDFLARFGLGEPRSQKSMRSRKNTRDDPASVIEAVPTNMRRILENIGLIRPRARSVDSRKDVSLQNTTPAKLHVFKPHEVSVFNDQQRAKISELLDTVKKVQQGKANIEAVQKVADEVLESTKTLPEGPDPASLEEILKLYKEDLKNEVKRRQAAENREKEVKEEESRKHGVVKKEVLKEEKLVQEENEEKDKQSGKSETELSGGFKIKGENEDSEGDVEKKETGAKDQKLTITSMASSGIKKFMVNILGTSEMWFGKIIGGLSKVKSFFTNVADSQAAAQDIVYTSVATTTASSTTAASSTTSESSTTTAAKGSFFETFDIEAALRNANAAAASNSSSEASNSNLSALEDSFGGTTPKPDPVLPTRRKTGLYFLVDWNTFLEVGEDDKEKVNLRFQPRVGDRTRFIKVTVP